MREHTNVQWPIFLVCLCVSVCVCGVTAPLSFGGKKRWELRLGCLPLEDHKQAWIQIEEFGVGPEDGGHHGRIWGRKQILKWKLERWNVESELEMECVSAPQNPGRLWLGSRCGCGLDYVDGEDSRGQGGPWRLNSFTAWLAMRCKSQGVECDLHSPPWLGGGTSNALRDLVNQGVGEWGGLESFALCSHKKAQLFLLGPESRLYFSQWPARVCKKHYMFLSPWGEACESFLSLQGILWCCMLLSSSTKEDSRIQTRMVVIRVPDQGWTHINIYSIFPWSEIREEVAC